MEKMNPVKPLFPNLPERLAGLEELVEKSLVELESGRSLTPTGWGSQRKAMVFQTMPKPGSARLRFLQPASPTRGKTWR